MRSHMKDHGMTWMKGHCVKVTSCLQGKQRCCKALGTVNICTVKAWEVDPSSFPLSRFLLFWALINTTEQNNNNTHKKEQGVYHWLVCAAVLWQLQSLNLFSASAGRRAALYNRVTPRRHLSSGVFSEHAYLFSDNSLHSLRTIG